MRSAHKILFKSVTKPFYRENAALFVFVFAMMFFIVSKVDGAELLAYHYSLILATLKSRVVLALVLLAWTIYARKCFAFVSARLYKPEFAYLQVFNSLPGQKRFMLFFVLQSWLLLPISLYALLLIAIGLWQHHFLPVAFIIGFLLGSSAALAFWHVKQLTVAQYSSATRQRRTVKRSFFSSYPFLLLRFVAGQQKLLWLGFKFFTCSLLYLLARNNSGSDYETKAVYLFYSFGILAQAVLVLRLRQFEESRLGFYRSLPVRTNKRFADYAAVYALLLVPEFVVTALLTPVHLHYVDAASFFLNGFNLVLLVHSLTFALSSNPKEFLKVLLPLFFLQYFFMLGFGLLPLCVLFFIMSMVVFRVCYFRYEHSR